MADKAIFANFGDLNLVNDSDAGAITATDEAITGSTANLNLPNGKRWRSLDGTGTKQIDGDWGGATKSVKLTVLFGIVGPQDTEVRARLYSDTSQISLVKTFVFQNVYRHDGAASADELDLLENTPHNYYGFELDSEDELVAYDAKSWRIEIKTNSGANALGYWEARWVDIPQVTVQHKLDWTNYDRSGVFGSASSVKTITGYEHVARGYVVRALNAGLPPITTIESDFIDLISLSAGAGENPFIVIPYPINKRIWATTAGVWKMKSMPRSRPKPKTADSTGSSMWSTALPFKEWL